MAGKINMNPKRNPMPAQDAEKRGKNFEEVTYGYSEDYPSGQVIEQQYNSGTSLTEGTSVSIKVSKGPEPQQPDEPADEEVE